MPAPALAASATPAAVLTAEQLALLPSDAEVAEYRRCGYYLSRPIIPDAVLDRALAGAQRFWRDERDGPLPDGKLINPKNWTLAGDPQEVQLRKNDYAQLQIRELAALVRHPLIGAIAARLSGAAQIRLWHDQLLYKPSGTGDDGNVGWHTDKSYWKPCSSDEMLTAWVPFTEVTADMGPVMMVPRDRVARPDAPELSFFGKDMNAQELAMGGGRPVVKTAMVMRRGQVSFHHCKTVHGSGANTSGRPRMSLAIHLQPGDNRWRRVARADGSVVKHDNCDYVRRDADGNPDYSDPVVCPVLYP